jgi:hypothetical protein
MKFNVNDAAQRTNKEGVDATFRLVCFVFARHGHTTHKSEKLSLCMFAIKSRTLENNTTHYPRTYRYTTGIVSYPILSYHDCQ